MMETTSRLPARVLRTGLAVALAIAGLLAALPVDAELNGGRVYRRACARCHGPHGRGDGPDAADFKNPPRDLRSGFVDRYSAAALARRVRRGVSLQLELDPRALRARSEEVDTVVAYLKRLPVIDWARVARGRDVYLERCEPCHGTYGYRAPASAPPVGAPRNLSDVAFQHETTDDDLSILVRHGRTGMPKLTPRLTDPEAVDVAAYVRMLSPGYETYSRFCANCHGEDGRGTEGPGRPPVIFNSAFFESHDSARVRDAVWHMVAEKKPSMPHFRHELSETATHAVIEFLKGADPDGR